MSLHEDRCALKVQIPTNVITTKLFISRMVDGPLLVASCTMDSDTRYASHTLIHALALCSTKERSVTINPSVDQYFPSIETRVRRYRKHLFSPVCEWVLSKSNLKRKEIGEKKAKCIFYKTCIFGNVKHNWFLFFFFFLLLKVCTYDVSMRHDARNISDYLHNWTITSKCSGAFAIKVCLWETHDLTTTSARNATSSVSLVARISNENSTELMRSRAAAFKGLNRIGAI